MLGAEAVIAIDDPQILIAPPYPPLVAARTELTHRDAQRDAGLAALTYGTVDVFSASPESMLGEHAHEVWALGDGRADKGGAGDALRQISAFVTGGHEERQAHGLAGLAHATRGGKCPLAARKSLSHQRPRYELKALRGMFTAPRVAR